LKIAYISLHWPRSIESSVGNKINMQINYWRDAGQDVRFFMHTHHQHGVDPLLEGEVFDFNLQSRLPWREFERISALNALVRSVKRYRPDVIYLRYGVFVMGLQQLKNIAPVCVEINTNDLIEHKRLGKIIAFYNKITRAITLKNATAFVFESNSLAEDPNFSKFHKPTAVIGNGIDLSRVDPLPAPNNASPRLIFVGTPGYSWHGVDKLETLARTFPDIHIDVVGYDSLPNAADPPKNLQFHGFLDRDSMRQMFRKADAAISSMALHRIQKTDGTPLKTLEYLTYGLPVVLPYQDTNLKELEADFLLRIPDDETNILAQAEKIYQFVWRMRGKRAPRYVIAPYIDSTIKEKERLAFFESIINNH